MSKKWVPEDLNDIKEQLKINHSLISTYQHSLKCLENASPSELKQLTAESKKLDRDLEKLSLKLKKSKSDLMEETINILNELKSDTCVCVKKTLIYSLFSVLSSNSASFYVNETNMNLVKQSLGKNPVVFVPTHKSLVDDVILGILKTNYGINQVHIVSTTELAGNKLFRLLAISLGSFFMRRTFINDDLYQTVLNQFINTLMKNSSVPLEVFIEGTRSKTNKGLVPKYGLMKMILEKLFTGDVPDITFVPVNVSYDRLAEENGFVYEMLGLPKLSYSLFSFSSLIAINNVYYNIGTPISAKEYLGLSARKLVNSNKPLAEYVMGLEEQELVKTLSHEIIYRQKEFAFITTYNMIAFCIMMSLYNSKSLTKQQLVKTVIKLTKTVRDFNGHVFDHDENNTQSRIDEAIRVHSTSIKEVENEIVLVRKSPGGNIDNSKKKFKGHEFSTRAVAISAPIIVLQIYVNGIVPLLFPSLVICTILNKGSYNKESLWNNFKKFRQLFKFEFIINEPTLKKEFEDHMKILEENLVILVKDDKIVLGSNKDQFHTFINLMWPFIVCFQTVVEIVSTGVSMEEKDIMVEVQKLLESEFMEKNNVHPYSLTLDCIQNSIKGLTAENILKREFKGKMIVYHVNKKEIIEIKDWISRFSLNIKVDFSENNGAIVWG